MKNRKMNTRRLTQLALLAAIVLVMSYTPLGYLPLGPLNCSLLTIPVAIGAMLMGPTAGAVLGGVFGLTSFLNALEGKSQLGQTLLSISPAGYFVQAVVGRILMGLCCGLIYLGVSRLLAKAPHGDKISCAIGGVSAPLFNTIFYMGAMVLFFYNTDYIQGLAAGKGAANPFMFILLMVGVQGAMEMVVGCLVSTAVTVPLRKFLKNS